MLCLFFLMIRQAPRSTRTDTLFPYTTPFRSQYIERGTEWLRDAGQRISGRLHAFAATLSGAVDRDRRDVAEAQRQERLAAERTREQRSDEHTSELQSLMRISYAVFCLQKKTLPTRSTQYRTECTSNHQQ